MTDGESTSEGESRPPDIDTLSAVVVTTARERRGEWMFVGWTADGLPAATGDQRALSEGARRSAVLYQGAGLEPRRIPYARVTPVEYAMTGAAIDFADTRSRRAEDQIRYSVLDGSGQRQDIALGELAVLGAIVEAKDPWQASAGGPEADIAISTVPFYTLFVPQPGSRVDSCVAMLFRSTIPGSGNEAAFRSFVRQTVGRLLVLDESQPRRQRKGYLRVAGRLAGSMPTGGLSRTLLWMRSLGLVDFSDQWIRSLGMRGQLAKVHLARVMRSFGLVDVSDDALERMKDVRPDYDIDPLDTEQVTALAEGMYKAAREALR